VKPAAPRTPRTDRHAAPLSGLGLFVVAAFLLLITPGPAVLYIVARSMDQGRRAGLVSMLGVHTGALVHIAAAAAARRTDGCLRESSL
jgi:threonine/homoserine/homoserine lactone efflux protein